MQVSDLTQTLASYSKSANDATTSISSAIRPIAFILLMIFFLIELNNWKSVLSARGQMLTRKLWIELAIKYFIALALILTSDLVSDTLLEIGNTLIKVANNAVKLESLLYQFDSGEISGWIERMILNLLGSAVQFIANTVAILLLVLRFVELYVLKAIAPVLIAFFMSEPLRNVAINYFKTYGAYVMVTFGMLVVTVIFNFLAKDDFLNALGKASAGDFGVAFASIGKGVIYILMIAGMTRKAKQWIGVT